MTPYRNRQFSQLLFFVAAVFAAGSIVLAISRDEASGGGRWAPAIVVVAISVFVWTRLARSGVYAGEREIRVVNPLKTERVPWEHVLKFDLRPHKGFPALGFVELIDGRRIEVWGLQARSSNVASKRAPQAVIDELNERLREQRSHEEPGSPPPGDP